MRVCVCVCLCVCVCACVRVCVRACVCGRIPYSHGIRTDGHMPVRARQAEVPFRKGSVPVSHNRSRGIAADPVKKNA